MILYTAEACINSIRAQWRAGTRVQDRLTACGV